MCFDTVDLMVDPHNMKWHLNRGVGFLLQRSSRDQLQDNLRKMKELYAENVKKPPLIVGRNLLMVQMTIHGYYTHSSQKQESLFSTLRRYVSF